ncbi:MAG: hypothetical protein AAGN66_06980 [Acidobacteriota bacterium]
MPNGLLSLRDPVLGPDGRLYRHLFGLWNLNEDDRAEWRVVADDKELLVVVPMSNVAGFVAGRRRAPEGVDVADVFDLATEPEP